MDCCVLGGNLIITRHLCLNAVDDVHTCFYLVFFLVWFAVNANAPMQVGHEFKYCILLVIIELRGLHLQSGKRFL